MVDNTLEFIAEAFLSAFLAGLATILIALAIEKLGGLKGGVLATFPSTVVPFSLGIAAQYENDFVKIKRALCTVGIVMIGNALFLWVWRFIPVHFP